MNTQEIAWAEELSRRLINLEKNQVSLMTLLSKIHRLEFKQAKLINDIKKLKKIQTENTESLNNQIFQSIEHDKPHKHPLHLVNWTYYDPRQNI